MLTLQRLSRQSHKYPLYQNLGVSLLPGCLMRVEGANGSGKTMLLESIAGQQEVDKGHILFAEQETRGDSEFFNEVMYLPESFPHYKAKITVAKQLERWASKEQQELLDAAVHYFELKYVLEEKLADLSVGWLMKVKLALLVLKPSLIWLLDRPFYGLDEKGRVQLETLIAGRCRQNGMVFFTHDGETRLNPHHTLYLEDWIAV